MFILPLWLNIVDSCSKSDTGIKVTYDIDGEKFDYQYEPDDGISNTNLKTGGPIMSKVQKVFLTPPP